jgi:hypothetical protein
MGLMDFRYMKKIKSVMQWGKIILPLSSIRYYPPQFTLRNPLMEGVTNAFKNGLEVAVIVFKLRNLNDLLERADSLQHSKLTKNMKKLFQTVVGQTVNPKDLITLHDYYGEGITLLITVDHDRHSISNLDILLKKITDEVSQSYMKQYSSVNPTFEVGYMFVDKYDYSIQNSIFRVHRQA